MGSSRRLRRVPAERPFDLYAVRREFYGWTLILTPPLVLDVIEDWHETHVLEFDALWTSTAVIGMAIFVMVRFAKKQTRLLAKRA